MRAGRSRGMYVEAATAEKCSAGMSARRRSRVARESGRAETIREVDSVREISTVLFGEMTRRRGDGIG